MNFMEQPIRTFKFGWGHVETAFFRRYLAAPGPNAVEPKAMRC
jgi:hypothetical protein